MDIKEIFELHDWYTRMEERYNLIQKISNLNQILQSNINPGNNRNNKPQPIQSFKDEREAVVDAMSKILIGQLTNSQIKWLEVHSAMTYMGVDSAQKFNQHFIDDASDLAALASIVQHGVNSLGQTRSGLESVCNPLKPYYKAVKGVSYPDDATRLSIFFKGEVGIENLTEFQERLKEWNKILKCLAVAFDRPSDEFNVLGARNGSIVVDLYVAAAAILPLGYILNRSFNILERLALSIRRIRGIATLDFTDPEFASIEKSILEESDRYFSVASKKAAKEISKEVLDEIDCDDGRREEADNNLRKAVAKIMNHLKKGGDLDLHIPYHENEDDDDDDKGGTGNPDLDKAFELIEDFREKRIESDFKTQDLLELFDFDDEDDDEDDDG